MKIAASLLLLAVLSSCARSGATPSAPSGGGPSAGGGEVRCELVKLEGVHDGDAIASFRVVNGTSTPVSYTGFGKESPMYQAEVEDGGAWVAHPMGWCGTGSSTIALDPGASQVVDVIVPADGRQYRFSFGEPPVVTPAVSFEK